VSVFVIAEVGSSCNGNFHLAKEMILEADRVGADAVKFQALETSVRNAWAPRLKEIADDVGVELMITPFDTKAVDAWEPYVKRWKIASAELVNRELIRYASAAGKPMVLSTGMASHGEVIDALELCWKDWWEGSDVPVVLQCVGSYPAPVEHMNLRFMLRDLGFGRTPGLSDHTIGTHIPIAAVALGAEVIEKHIKPSGVNFSRANVPVDRSHPDHGDFTLYPQTFQYMVRCIRDVEKALGDGIKRPMPGEAMEARGRRLESV